jgi:ribulose-5-phosphate 4-epimerase/fuculose-1-phosphate aldolase
LRGAGKTSIELRLQLSLELQIAREFMDDVSFAAANHGVFAVGCGAVDRHAVIDEVDQP